MSAPAVLFHIDPYRGLWRVTVDGAFYGLYRSNALSQEAAEEGVEALLNAGRDAKIVFAHDEVALLLDAAQAEGC